MRAVRASRAPIYPDCRPPVRLTFLAPPALAVLLQTEHRCTPAPTGTTVRVVRNSLVEVGGQNRDQVFRSARRWLRDVVPRGRAMPAIAANVHMRHGTDRWTIIFMADDKIGFAPTGLGIDSE